MSDLQTFGGFLSDYRLPRLKIACAPCGRHGDYSTRTLRALYGNPPMEELPRLIALRGNCPLALRYPGTECGAWFVREGAPKVEYLGDAHHAGWALILTCERSHQGLKSVKPCRHPALLDLKSMVAVLGHTFPIDQLSRKLICPGCGSRHYSLTWIIPKDPGKAAEPAPLRRVS